MDLIWTNTAHVPQGELVSPALDLQYGDEQNDFELTHATPGLLLSDGCYIGAEGTEFGGRVDAVRITVDDGHALYTLTGRTWHGLLAGKIIQPDSGADRLTVSGDANSIIRTVISRIGLSTVFDVPSEASGINISNYSFRRYITAWDGLRMMLTAQGARLDLTYTAGRCRIRAVAADTYGDADSDQRISFEAQRIWTQVNHLTGLGKGQLRNRARSDWYADASGNISQTQTLTGDREIAQIYELTSSEGAELSDQTRDKLKDMWKQGTVDLTIPENLGLHIDDHVRAYDALTGVSVDSPIVRITVKLANGTPTIRYEAGQYSWPDEQD